MKRIYNLLLPSLALILVACGGETETVQSIASSGDMEAIRGKKKELSAQKKDIELEIALLDSAIAAGTENTNLPLITTASLKTVDFDHFIELQGSVTTDQNVVLFPEVAGSVIQVMVEEGQKVKKDQLLMRIDDGGLESQIAQMESQFALAETTFKRQESLWKKNIGSEIQYLQAKTNYESQKNALAQMKTQLGKFRIRAPFSGIVDDVMSDVGNVVAPGTGIGLVRVINLSDMYVDVLVPEAYLPSIVSGKKASAYFPVLGETVETYVEETGNFINPGNRSFRAKIPVPNKNGQIKPNLSAKVKMNDYSSEEAILIPQGVVSENAEGDEYVYVVTKGKNSVVTASKRIIETGKTQGGSVEVLEGLKAGDQVIIEGARSVKDGQQVKILKK